MSYYFLPRSTLFFSPLDITLSKLTDAICWLVCWVLDKCLFTKKVSDFLPSRRKYNIYLRKVLKRSSLKISKWMPLEVLPYSAEWPLQSAAFTLQYMIDQQCYYSEVRSSLHHWEIRGALLRSSECGRNIRLLVLIDPRLMVWAFSLMSSIQLLHLSAKEL